MRKKDAGQDNQPFYQNIVDKNKRHIHPPKPARPAGEADSSRDAPTGYRGRPDDRASRDNRDSRPAPSGYKGKNPDGRATRSSPRDAAFSESAAPRKPRKPFDGPVMSTPVFGKLTAETRALLDAFPEIVQTAVPLDSKMLQSLPSDIRELSHELTDERSDRRVGYLNDPAALSAYIRYYMWWNLVRHTRLFSALPITLEDGDAAADLGSGPLTLPIALWMARPDLRDKKITWYCVDISQGALAAGEEIFLSLAAKTGNEPWTIVRVKGEFGVSLRKRVKLAASANMFNELFQDNPLPLEAQAKHHAQELASYAADDAAILLIEPGVPRAGRFVSLMRDALMRLGFDPEAPCPHMGPCPFPGLRYGKWCHFVFETEDAPTKLHKLSEDAGLSKDRAALSFVYSRRTRTVAEASGDTGTSETVSENSASTESAGEASLSTITRLSSLFPNLKVRITSDPIRLPDFYTGRYGCSELGMVMITGTYAAADWLKECHSGSLIEVPMPDKKRPERDQKTGAILIRLA
jgi:hypothetical protein